jgi:ABC-2 type transport system permease protein
MSSSDKAWRSTETDVMPSVDAAGNINFSGDGEARERADIAVVLEGEFTSAFDAVPEAPTAAESAGSDDEGEALEAPSSGLISKSPESARLLVVSSNDFVSDQVLSGVIAAAGTQYFGSLEFMLNAVDWALEDNSLMSIRSRAHFNRTLPPLSQETQASIEYGNYAVALFALAALFGAWRLLRRRREAQLAEVLA